MKKTTQTITESYASIKLGIDAHAKWYYVARQLDGTTPQPVRKMTFDGRHHSTRSGCGPISANLA
jgi:hypothetical protein